MRKVPVICVSIILAIILNSGYAWGDKAATRIITQKILSASVAILLPAKDESGRDIVYPACGGTLIDPRVVLAAAHCVTRHPIEGAEILLWTGETIGFRVGKADEAHDLALLILAKSTNLTPAVISEDIQVGDIVLLVGSPLGNPFVFSSGRVSQMGEAEFKYNDFYGGVKQQYIVSDAWGYYGSSGGGMFDEDGNLIGVDVVIFHSENTDPKQGPMVPWKLVGAVGGRAILNWLEGK